MRKKNSFFKWFTTSLQIFCVTKNLICIIFDITLIPIFTNFTCQIFSRLLTVGHYTLPVALPYSGSHILQHSVSVMPWLMNSAQDDPATSITQPANHHTLSLAHHYLAPHCFQQFSNSQILNQIYFQNCS